MRTLDVLFVQEFIRMSADAWGKGWHERNGGNLSYRLSPEDVAEINLKPRADGDWVRLARELPELAGEHFLLTGQGKYMRNVILDPPGNLALMVIDQQGAAYQLLWGLRQGEKPSSELPTHLLIHATKKKIGQNLKRVVYHAHPANLIALSFVLPPDSRDFTRTLWSMMPECLMVFPEGLGVLPGTVPGEEETAARNALLMEKHNAVIWSHHGVFCAGNSFDEAFGLMETLEKAGEICVKILSMGGAKSAPSSRELRRLAAALHLEVNKDFLNY
jgi:rhamnulose-1-phosphate aldolase